MDTAELVVNQDFIRGGPRGEVAEMFGDAGYQPGLFRPYYDEGLREVCVTVNTGEQKYNKDTDKYEPVFAKMTAREARIHERFGITINSETSLRVDEWRLMDRKVLEIGRQRLRAWRELAAANTYSVAGMTKSVLEHETMSDSGEAFVDMDGIRDGRNDEIHFELQGLPLPFTYSAFHMTRRNLLTSRAGGTPLDTAKLVNATIKVSEAVERTLLGINTGLTYGNTSLYGRAPTVYGYTTHPARLTKVLTVPTGSNNSDILNEFIDSREQLYANNYYGPFVVYLSSNWDKWLDKPFSTTEPSAGTLRDFISKIDGLSVLRRADYLVPADSTDYTTIWVQMTENVARAVNGMDLVTTRWETRGGEQINFKVSCIYVPQIRADFNDQCGILHGNTP